MEQDQDLPLPQRNNSRHSRNSSAAVNPQGTAESSRNTSYRNIPSLLDEDGNNSRMDDRQHEGYQHNPQNFPPLSQMRNRQGLLGDTPERQGTTGQYNNNMPGIRPIGTRQQPNYRSSTNQRYSFNSSSMPRLPPRMSQPQDQYGTGNQQHRQPPHQPHQLRQPFVPQPGTTSRIPFQDTRSETTSSQPMGQREQDLRSDHQQGPYLRNVESADFDVENFTL
jgi:hypothetical protein